MERTCIVCRKKMEKAQFFRIVKFADGRIAFDPTGKAQGRGCYVCHDEKCIARLRKSGALSRSLHCAVDAAVYQKIEEQLHEQ